MNEKDQKLQRILELAKIADTLTNTQAKQFVELLVGLTNKQKEELVKKFNEFADNVSQETHSKITEAIAIVSEKHKDAMLEVRQLTNKQKKAHEDRMQELQDTILELQSIEIKDGYTPEKGVDYFTKEDIQEIETSILSKVPKEYELLGENVVDSINSLEVTPDKQIDAKHIKNLPKTTQFVGGSSGITEIVAGSGVTVDNSNPKYPVVSSSGGGHVIEDEGTPLTQRANLNFVGSGVAVTDDAGNDATVVTISSGGGAVDSVNGQTGVVVLDADDIDDTSTTNKFVTSSDITKLSNLSGTNTGDVTVLDSSEIDFTLTGQQITASLVAGSIDETKLDTSVNASLDLADTSVQPATLTGYFNKSTDDTDDITVGATNKFATSAEKTKLGFISITQAVDLDTMESDIANKQPLDTQLTSLAGLSYTGNALKVIRVNAGETDFELATVSAGPSFGTDNQIPYVNAGGTDFDYSANLTFNGTALALAGNQTISQGTITTDVKALDISSTWNNAAVAFTGIKLNATQTASASTSLLMDLQRAGTSVFKVARNGAVTIDPGSGFGSGSSNPVLTLRSFYGTSSFYGDASSILHLTGSFQVDSTLYLGAGIGFQAIGQTVNFNSGNITNLSSMSFNGSGSNIKMYHDYNGFAAQADQGIIMRYANRTSGSYPRAAFQVYNSSDSTEIPFLVSSQGFAWLRNSKTDEVVLTIKGATSQTANLQSWIDSSNTVLASVAADGNISVPDEAYDATSWNGSFEVPTKNAIRDKIESMSGITDGDKGDITVSGSGATWTIDNGVVSLAKQADVATGTVFYRKTAGTGSPEVQTLATLKTDLGLTGTNTGDQTSIVGITGTKAQFDTAVTDGNFLYVGDITQYTDEMAQDAVGAMVDSTLVYTDGTPLLSRAALTGDVTASAGSNSTTIANDAVTFAKFQNITDNRLLGRSAGSTGDMQEITVGSGLSLSGGTLSASGGSSGWGFVSYTTGTGSTLDVSSLDLSTDLAYKVIVEMNTDSSGDNGSFISLRINSSSSAEYDEIVTRNRFTGGSASTGQEGLGGNQNWYITGTDSGTIPSAKINTAEILLTRGIIDGTNYRVMARWEASTAERTDGTNDIIHWTGAGFNSGQSNVTSLNFLRNTNTGSPTQTWKVWVYKANTA